MQQIYSYNVLKVQQKKHINYVKSILLFVTLPLIALDWILYINRMIGYNNIWYILISMCLIISFLFTLDGVYNYYKINKLFKLIELQK